MLLMHIVASLSVVSCARVLARSTSGKMSKPAGLGDGAVTHSETPRQKMTRWNEMRILDTNPTGAPEDVGFSLTHRNGSHKDAIRIKTRPNPAEYDDAKTNAINSETSSGRKLHFDSASSEVNHRSRRTRRAVLDSNVEYIQLTVFSNWRVLAAISVAEVIVYIITVSIVLVLHRRQRNKIVSVRDGALTSRHQFTL